ncbi:MAG: serine/threonine-protein kinase [Acidobacteriota bacterium]
MKQLSDKQLKHLIEVVDRPDFSSSHYRVIREIARGGMGTVYLAEDTQLTREVAIKVLNTVELSPEMCQRMRREAEIIARLEHPGIIPVHDVGSLPDGRIFYVMKYVRGKRLDEHVQDSLSLNERLRLFRTACEAVAFAHAHSVVHRDLKPENIMVGPFGEVLVMDWGIAKVLGDEEPTAPGSGTPQRGVTAHGTILGTPSYMSPEQAAGDVGCVDQRTDVYALGSILYYLLANEVLPAIEGGGRSVALNIPPNRRIPKRLQAICLKALAWEPGERYSNAQSLGGEIERYLDDEPIEAYQENALETAIRWVDRHRFIVLLVLAYILMRVILILAAKR